MKIRKEIQDELENLKNYRRRLHEIPEVKFETFETMKMIQRLSGRNADEFDGFSGVFYLKGKTKKCMAFRCELDGLAIQEKNKVSYASKNKAMHACGHDAHMAILLCMMNYYKLYPSDVSLLFIFQPAEESGAGAKYMIQKNIFEKYQVAVCFALHVMPTMSDFIGCKEGILMAKSCEFDILIQGKAAHAVHANQGIDSMKAMNLLLNEIYEIQKELLPNIVHVGKIESGQIGNGISEVSRLYGTIRSLTNGVFDGIKEFIQNKCIQADEQMNTKSYIQFSDGYDCVENDGHLVQKIKEIAKEDYLEISSVMLSEDFSFYKTKCPCCMYFCGLHSKIDLHDSKFDLDEEDCLKAIEMNVSLVEQLICEIM